MKWDEEAAAEVVRSAWAYKEASDGRAEVFTVFECSDGTYHVSLPYVGSAPAGTRMHVVGRSADHAVARALREIDCRGSGGFFRGF